jgi:hypothetical protein
LNNPLFSAINKTAGISQFSLLGMALTTERDIRIGDKPFQHALAAVLALQSAYHETQNSEQQHE